MFDKSCMYGALTINLFENLASALTWTGFQCRKEVKSIVCVYADTLSIMALSNPLKTIIAPIYLS
jgi:hypothetical protein